MSPERTEVEAIIAFVEGDPSLWETGIAEAMRALLAENERHERFALSCTREIDLLRSELEATREEVEHHRREVEVLRAGEAMYQAERRSMSDAYDELRSELAAARGGPNAGWLPLSEAPAYVYGRDALVGEWVEGYGWKKVSIWEREWTRDEIASRGGTHWWPHLLDLPAPHHPRGPAE